VDPLWASIAEFWWIAPAAAGAGALGVIGVRRPRRPQWRIAYDAARAELRTAQSRAAAATSAVRIARAQLSRVHAERATLRATDADVAAARHALQHAQHEVKAAGAAVRVHRARVAAERKALASGSDPAHAPVARLHAAYDAVTARWMSYETDPAKLISFPALTDPRVPATSAFIAARSHAQETRPADGARLTPDEYVAYRDAVENLERTFTAAEAEAWRQARAVGGAPPEPDHWSITAQSAVLRSSEMLARSGEALARMAESAAAAVRDARAARDDADDADQTPRPPRTPRPPERDAPPPRVWPVPGRGRRRAPDA
jgi:hypothetical protein